MLSYEYRHRTEVLVSLTGFGEPIPFKLNFYCEGTLVGTCVLYRTHWYVELPKLSYSYVNIPVVKCRLYLEWKIR